MDTYTSALTYRLTYAWSLIIVDSYSGLQMHMHV